MARKLTIKQQDFIDEYIRNKGNATNAYKHAYNIENMKDNTIRSKACLLLKQGNITITLKQQQAKLDKAVKKEFVKTRLDLLQEYETIKNEEETDNKTKIDCMKEQGKLLGYYVERIESENKNYNILPSIKIKNKDVDIKIGNPIDTTFKCIDDKKEGKNEDKE